MALQVINTTITNAAVAVSLGTVDSVLIGQSGLVASTGGNHGIYGVGGGHNVRIAGITTGFSGVCLGDSNTADAGQIVYVADSGYVSGSTYGVLLNSFLSSVTNFGTIEATTGVYFNGSNGISTSYLKNGGTIVGLNQGVWSGGAEALSILNTGLIMGNNYSVLGSNLNDTLRNKGELVGIVELGNGADTYDGRGGSVEGQIRGGDGNDTFRVGLGAENIDGGLGTADVLDFRGGAAVKMALDGSILNTGAAAGDTYTGIEVVYGSQGADQLVGDIQNNLINGYVGKDVISGGAGTDGLTGGMGADQMTGGTGDDHFTFLSFSEGGDTISDFSQIAGDNDYIFVASSGFGASLVTGLLNATHFQSRTDNQAQDADDRFIFETDAHKLWFDINGNVAGGLSLVANFSNDAVLTAADIFVI